METVVDLMRFLLDEAISCPYIAHVEIPADEYIPEGGATRADFK